jgi:hypothetical protein
VAGGGDLVPSVDCRRRCSGREDFATPGSSSTYRELHGTYELRY